MRRTKARHVIAVLRHFLNLTQGKLAQITGVSEELVRSVELRRKPLSLSFAAKIASATGVDSEWLLKNDLDTSPCSSFAPTYTRDFYTSWRAQRSQPLPQDVRGSLPIFLLSRYVALRGVAEAAAEKSENDIQLLIHECEEFVANARAKYGSSPDFEPRQGPQTLTGNQLLIAEADVKAARNHLEQDARIFGVTKAPLPPPLGAER